MIPERVATIPSQNKIPSCLEPFFGDVDFRKLSVVDASDFITSRLMEHGDDSAKGFLLRAYTPEDMIAVVEESAALSRRSRDLWRVFFGHRSSEDLDLQQRHL